MIRTIDVGEGGLIDTYTRFNFVCVKNDYDTWTDGLEDRKWRFKKKENDAEWRGVDGWQSDTNYFV